MPSSHAAHILVIEGEPLVARLERRCLESAGYEVEVANSATEGLKRMERGGVDLLVLDHLLPDGNSFSFLERLEAQGWEVPVVIVTAVDEEQVAREAIERGVRDYVLQDATLPRYLPQTVRRVLKEVETERALQRRNRALRALQEVSTALSQSSNLTEVLQRAVEGVTKALAAKGCCLYWKEEETGDAVMVAHFACSSTSVQDPTMVRIPAGVGIWGRLQERRKGCVATEFASFSCPFLSALREEGIKSLAYVPLWEGEEVVGFLAVGSSEPEHFDQEDVQLLTSLGQQIVIAREKVRLFERVERAKNEWETTFDSIEDLIVLLNQDGTIVRVNEALARYFQATPEHLIGRKCYEVFHGLDHFLEGCPHLQLLRTGQAHSADLWEPGLGAWLNVSVYPRRSSEGDLLGSVHIVRDITKRQQLEAERERLYQELQQSEEKYRDLVENAQDVIFLLEGPDGHFTALNSYFEVVSGFKREDWLGKSFIGLVMKEDRLRAIEVYRRTLGGENTTCELRFRARNGEIRTFSLHNRPYRREGRIVGVIGIARDVTEQRNLEAQLRRVQRLDSLGTLAGGIAHDFRNVLTSIMGYADLSLGEVPPDSETARRLQDIILLCERAAGTVAQLLTFSRQMPSEKKPLSLNPLVKEMAKILRSTFPETIAIRYHLDENLGLINADVSQIHQALMNLCLNARDAMPEGGELYISTAKVVYEETEAAVHLDLKAGEYVCLSVGDTGVGMDEATKERIFEPFFTTKKSGQGNGLGLAMVWGIVKEHQGAIHVYSEPGQGSTFHLYFPCIPTNEEAITSLSKEIQEGWETLLLVEDDESIREVGRDWLEHYGYTVLTAADGQEALEIFRQKGENIALVITDMVMPKMGGVELCKALRGIKPQVRLLLTSGYSMDLVGEDLEAIGCHDFVHKPFQMHELAAKVREILDHRD